MVSFLLRILHFNWGGGRGVYLPLPRLAHVYKPDVCVGLFSMNRCERWDLEALPSLHRLKIYPSKQTQHAKFTGRRRATVTMPAVKSHSVTSFRHFKSSVCQTSWNLVEQICDAHRSRASLLSLNGLILNQIISVLTRRDKQSKKWDIALTSGGPGSFPSAISTFSSRSM